MSGIFYDPQGRAVRHVPGRPERGWVFLSHDTGISMNHCRRLLREMLPESDIGQVDFSTLGSGTTV